MRGRVGSALLAVALALGCGDTTFGRAMTRAGGGGNGEPGGASEGGTGGSAGLAAGGRGGNDVAGMPSAGGSGLGQAGTGFGGSAGMQAAGAGGALPCTPMPHVRPTAVNTTQAFDDLAPMLAGIYRIDNVFTRGETCDSMCPSGDAVKDVRPHPFVQLVFENERLAAYSCESVVDCADDMKRHGALGSFSSVSAENTLSLKNIFVESPQMMTCTGGSVDYKLYLLGPGKIRLDLEQTLVKFAPYISAMSGLEGCDSGDAMNAAFGQPCNGLNVIDATKVQ